jgi:homoserine dehydrogenase
MAKRAEVIEKYDVYLRVTVIGTRTKGTLINGYGIDLEKAEDDLKTFGRFQEASPSTPMEAVETADYDVLIELTTLDIFSGHPAIDHIQAAFNRGKHVISANKGPIAWAYTELKAMAAENNCLFVYETTVMDGAQIFNMTESCLKMCKVTEIRGILNSTTNFILEKLEKGVSYKDAVAEGKRRGFVEADPSLDVEGWDAAAKVTALMNVLMDARLTPLLIERKGIEDITLKEIEGAKKRGKVIKLICYGTIKNGKAKGYVKPEEIDSNDILASVTGTSSILTITTDLMGTLTIVEHAPEIEQTAYGVFSDTLRVIESLQ